MALHLNILLMVPCLFCSWVATAAHKEKSQGQAAAPQPRLEAEGDKVNPRFRLSRDSGYEDTMREDASPTGRLKSGVASMVDPQEELKIKQSNGQLNIVGSVAGGAKYNFMALLQDAEDLTLDHTNISDGVIPLTDAITKAPRLSSVTVRQSDTKDAFLFFLGSALRSNPHIDRVVLDGDKFTAIGLKSILIGLFEMKNLKHLSWRFMPLKTWILPFDDAFVHKKKGYESFEDKEIEVDIGQGKNIYSITFYRKPVWNFLIEDFLEVHKGLHTLDLTGSIEVDTKEDRDNLHALFDQVETMHHLEMLGLGHAKLDQFSVRRLSHALVKLAEAQSVHNEIATGKGLKTLNLVNTVADPENLKDLLKGVQALHTLEELNLAENKIGNKADFLTSLLPILRNLRILNLSKNKLFKVGGRPVRTGELLMKALESRVDTLEVLRLKENKMELHDLSHLKKVLLRCARLRVLDLRFNNLPDKAFNILTELLEALPGLETILVAGNNMTDDKYQKLSVDDQKKILIA